MYFRVKHKGKERELRVEERLECFVVRMRTPKQQGEWVEHRISKDHYRHLDNHVSFVHNNSSYIMDVLVEGLEVFVYTRGTYAGFEFLSDEALLRDSLRGKGGVADTDQLKTGMPGKITKVFVKEGAAVKEGEPLLIMEAMKMENEMRAQSAGTIKKILVSEGQSVESGAVLITFEA